ncbi:hypothetical protein G8O24_34040 [Bradyrhizobium sp. INPA01-394B]|uniref:Uncharacterized protein n=1 Tax=Bradyrhizobium campsiandrae TaxID=1729892 RepID=A0ABR7UGM2_9BRAD|nr:hypothetical protein [Bradyrhizobium campsiandrae]MBC9882335.1 hypothetical protein [Bradyrhizobium campsiandrae]MBC9983228.1 hypothetical protein [Bradyrhizobium campsiandrae]
MTFILNLKLTNHSFEIKKSSRCHSVALSVLTGRREECWGREQLSQRAIVSPSLEKRRDEDAEIRQGKNGISLPPQAEKKSLF